MSAERGKRPGESLRIPLVRIPIPPLLLIATRPQDVPHASYTRRYHLNFSQEFSKYAPPTAERVQVGNTSLSTARRTQTQPLSPTQRNGQRRFRRTLYNDRKEAVDSQVAISLQRGPVDPKFQLEGVVPTNHSFSQNKSK